VGNTWPLSYRRSKLTFNNYLPPKTMAFIVKLGDEKCLSWKEVQRILLNKVLFDLGMTCEHRRIGSAKKNGKPYCKDCWTRFEKIKERTYNFETKKWSNLEKFLPVVTFLDEFYKEKDRGWQRQGQVKAEDRKDFV
jgi:hypothetical protein